MTEDVPKVPPEVKFGIAVNSFWSIINAIWATTADNFAGVSYGVPWKKWVAGIKPTSEALGIGGTKNIIESFKIPGNDCTTVAKAHSISVDAMGFEPKIIEMSSEKAVVHETKCPIIETGAGIFPKFQDLAVEDMPCTAFDESVGKAVNPKITFRRGETICKGGKVCEHIWELKP
ncbi:MAG: hypothetical protein ACFFCD_13730 [Promethearchaeota archaeon]